MDFKHTCPRELLTFYFTKKDEKIGDFRNYHTYYGREIFLPMFSIIKT